MGGDKRQFDQQIDRSNGARSDVPFATKIGFDLNPMNRNLGIVEAVQYVIGKVLNAVIDTSKFVSPSQIIVTTKSFAAITGTLNIDLAAPKDTDHVYEKLSLTLGTTRVITALIINADTLDGPTILPVPSTATTHVFTSTVLPFVIPAGMILRLSVLSMSSGDGAATVKYQRVEKPQGLGFAFL